MCLVIIQQDDDLAIPRMNNNNNSGWMRKKKYAASFENCLFIATAILLAQQWIDFGKYDEAPTKKPR